MSEGVPNPKVLVVDDEPDIRELVQVALNFHGCAVTAGATGEEALRLAHACNPGLIVLDVLLPDIDGFEVCRQLRSEASHELRTPLTTIRGYAELYRASALGPDELPNAMRRIEQETGHADLSSAPGQGITVKLWIPVRATK